MKTIIAIILLISSVSAKFSSFIKLCKRDGKLNECVEENILSAKEHLKDGIPSLFALKYNPLILQKDYEFESDNLKMTLYKGFIFIGMDDFDIKKVNFELDNNFLELEWIYKNIMARGKYRFVGDLLKYKVDGEGICSVNTTNFGIQLTMNGDRQEKEGKTYINFNKIDSKLVLDKVKISQYFENLFPSVKENEAGNNFLNENVTATTLVFKPIVDTFLIGLTASNVQKLFNAYPIEELFPL